MYSKDDKAGESTRLESNGHSQASSTLEFDVLERNVCDVSDLSEEEDGDFGPTCE